MIIFFTASLRGKKENLDVYTQVDKILRQKNEVISDHVFKYDVDEVHEWDPEYRFSFYQALFNEIKTADILVAEATTSSINIGYEVCIALELKKNVIVLYQGDKYPELLKNIDDE